MVFMLWSFVTPSNMPYTLHTYPAVQSPPQPRTHSLSPQPLYTALLSPLRQRWSSPQSRMVVTIPPIHHHLPEGKNSGNAIQANPAGVAFSAAPDGGDDSADSSPPSGREKQRQCHTGPSGRGGLLRSPGRWGRFHRFITTFRKGKTASAAYKCLSSRGPSPQSPDGGDDSADSSAPSGRERDGMRDEAPPKAPVRAATGTFRHFPDTRNNYLPFCTGCSERLINFVPS